MGGGVVDMGGGTTDIAIFTKGSVVHSGVVAIGGNHVTNDIAVGLRTSIQDAESIKIKYGCAMSSMLSNDEVLAVSATGRKRRDISRSVLTKIIEPRVEEILALVSQEINNSGYKHVLSSGVVITGGSSLLEGFQELSEFLLELPVRRGTPHGISGLSDAVSSPIYSTAVGLLLYARGHSLEARFEDRDANIYGKVLSRMKTWIEGVF